MQPVLFVPFLLLFKNMFTFIIISVIRLCLKILIKIGLHWVWYLSEIPNFFILIFYFYFWGSSYQLLFSLNQPVNFVRLATNFQISYTVQKASKQWSTPVSTKQNFLTSAWLSGNKREANDKLDFLMSWFLGINKE